MVKSNKVLQKKARGRPATGRDPVTAIRLSQEMRDAVDGWAAKQEDGPGRSEAIRRLVEIGLAAGKTKTAEFNQRALKRASKVLDGMASDMKSARREVGLMAKTSKA